MLNPHQPHAILHEATDAATAATTSASTITTKLLCARPTDTSRTPTCLQRRQAEQCREDEVLPHAQRIALLAQQQPVLRHKPHLSPEGLQPKPETEAAGVATTKGAA